MGVSAEDAAKARFKARVAAWADRLNVKPQQVAVQRMTRKWASCSSRGRVCFAVDLLGQPRAFQDFVVVHELLHLRIPNHGKLFQAVLALHVPGWRGQERKMKSR